MDGWFHKHLPNIWAESAGVPWATWQRGGHGHVAGTCAFCSHSFLCFDFTLAEASAWMSWWNVCNYIARVELREKIQYWVVMVPSVLILLSRWGGHSLDFHSNSKYATSNHLPCHNLHMVYPPPVCDMLFKSHTEVPLWFCVMSDFVSWMWVWFDFFFYSLV